MQPRTSAFHSVHVSVSTHVTGMRSVHIRPDGGWQFPTKWSLQVLGDLRTNGRRRSVHVNSNWSSLSTKTVDLTEMVSSTTDSSQPTFK